MGDVAGPFYFAWVDPEETTFGVEHHRMDEYIFSAVRTLAEGQKPVLEIQMQNPHVGLLSPLRKQWAWFAWDKGYFTGVTGDGIEPLFFGHVVGTPTQIFEEVIAVQFVASPLDYKRRVQLVAEPMKVLPWYDPVFIDVGKRDDPDTILEAYAKLWDVDPVTHAVTAVGIDEGPDGNVDITADDHFYDSMAMSIGQPPATAILMDASVSWTQTARGVVDIGTIATNSYSGSSIISAWPKPPQSLGSGWFVFDSFAEDTAHTVDASTVTVSFSWQNTEKHHDDGDTMSISYSQTLPDGMSADGAGIPVTETITTGLLDPFHVDEDGDPSPLNLPAGYNATYIWPLNPAVVAAMTLQYVAERPRTERVIFMIRADTQPVLVDPDVDEESEAISLSGADVGVPILNLLNWTSVAGQAVTAGQLIFPDDPSLPGGRTIQVATNNGTAGTVAPDFSDIPGDLTVDGTVTWSSLGQSSPLDNSNDWAPNTHIVAGTIILPRQPFYVTAAQLARTVSNRPRTSVQNPVVSEGQIIRGDDGIFRICVLGGELPHAEFWTLGSTLPSGTTYQLAVQSGVTGAQHHIPPFSDVLHQDTTDGTVVWRCIGTGDIPIGGTPGNISSPSYFTKDRGRQSLEYLALLVRARLMYRARCVQLQFETDYTLGTEFSTRKTVTLHDPRIPGGVATGKVTGAVLSVSDSGVASCQVTISCMLGKDNVIEEVEGTPSYVDDDYVESDYQFYVGATILVSPSDGDLSYTMPQYRVVDDGLVFPLTRDQVVVVFEQRGDADAQAQAVRSAIEQTSSWYQIQHNVGDPAELFQFSRQMTSSSGVGTAVDQHPVWVEFQIKPVNSGPFHGVYNVKFSDLTLSRGIDLEAEVTT